MKKCVFLVICSLFLSACTMFPTSEPTIVLSDYLLGTIVSVKIYDKSYSPEVVDCLSKVRNFENVVSYEDKNSELSVINIKAHSEPVKASEELFGLLEAAMGYCYKTEGAFDIGLGKLIEAWGIGTENAEIPSQGEIDNFINFKGYEHIILNNAERTVFFTDDRVKIHLGACAKGYAEDLIAEHLSALGVKSAILDFGGSITSIGTKNNGEPFMIGVTSPENNGIIGTIEISDTSAVTSGDYQRYFERDGIRYHHILDSRTAFPAQSGISSVTIISDSAFIADCLSTAAFVMGSERAVEMLSSEGCGYIIVEDDLKIINNVDFYEQS